MTQNNFHSEHLTENRTSVFCNYLVTDKYKGLCSYYLLLEFEKMTPTSYKGLTNIGRKLHIETKWMFSLNYNVALIVL